MAIDGPGCYLFDLLRLFIKLPWTRSTTLLIDIG